MKNIIFISGNPKKLSEVKALFPTVCGTQLELPEIQSLDCKEIITAKIKKALEVYPGPVMVDDTCLDLDCFARNGRPNFPGPLIKWFLESIGNRGVVDIAKKYKNMRAVASTTIAYATDPDTIHFFTGSLSGKLVDPEGTIGFGWDAVFVPDGYTQTLGSMSVEAKNSMSMRAIALRKLQEFLKTH